MTFIEEVKQRVLEKLAAGYNIAPAMLFADRWKALVPRLLEKLATIIQHSNTDGARFITDLSEGLVLPTINFPGDIGEHPGVVMKSPSDATKLLINIIHTNKKGESPHLQDLVIKPRTVVGLAGHNSSISQPQTLPQNYLKVDANIKLPLGPQVRKEIARFTRVMSSEPSEWQQDKRDVLDRYAPLLSPDTSAIPNWASLRDDKKIEALGAFFRSGQLLKPNSFLSKETIQKLDKLLFQRILAQERDDNVLLKFVENRNHISPESLEFLRKLNKDNKL